MGKFVFAYTGGSAPESPEEQQAVMSAWTGWLGELDGVIVDRGNPFMTSSTVSADGSVGAGGASGLTGYSIVSADSLDAAGELAKGCPIFAGGGKVEVYEAHEM
jgi:hypothetical protein